MGLLGWCVCGAFCYGIAKLVGAGKSFIIGTICCSLYILGIMSFPVWFFILCCCLVLGSIMVFLFDSGKPTYQEQVNSQAQYNMDVEREVQRRLQEEEDLINNEVQRRQAEKERLTKYAKIHSKV